MAHGKRCVVIGGGIGGLTAAIALRRTGTDVSVHERTTGPSEIGAGISMWGNAVRVFDALGVGEAIRSIGERLRVGEMRLASGRVQSAMDMLALDAQLGVTSLLVHRAELQRVLLEALPPNLVQFGQDLTEILPTNHGVEVRFRSGETITADCVVGADGLGSVSRAYVYGPPPNDPLRYSGYTCWRGVVSAKGFESIPPGYVCETWGRGTRFGVLRLSNDRIYWFATTNSPPRLPAASDIERPKLLSLVADFWDPIPRIVEATPTNAILRHDLYDRVPRRTWSRGRVVLLGDAAHPTTPNIGQGGCLAVEDGFVLARELARDADIAAAFARYEAARFERCAEITRFSFRLGIVGQWKNPLLCSVRDFVFRLTPPSAIEARHRRYVGFDATS